MFTKVDQNLARASWEIMRRAAEENVRKSKFVYMVAAEAPLNFTRLTESRFSYSSLFRTIIHVA